VREKKIDTPSKLRKARFIFKDKKFHQKRFIIRLKGSITLYDLN
jgi:hypothetical protein